MLYEEFSVRKRSLSKFFIEILNKIQSNSNSGNVKNENITKLIFTQLLYEGRSKSVEPDYLPLDFWAKKCYWP